MSDTMQTPARERPSVADRQWIDHQNNEVDSAEEATGCRYVDKPTNKAFIYQTGLPAGGHATMLAIFGALTKAGNIRSTLVNGPKGDPQADVIEGIEAWFDELQTNGIWSADRVAGIRVNADILARAIAIVKREQDHTPYLDKINSRLKVKEGGNSNKEILYSTFALRNKAVETKYNELLPQHAIAPAIGDL